MGNIGSTGGGANGRGGYRTRRSHPSPSPPALSQPPLPEITANRYVFAAATPPPPPPPQFPNTNNNNAPPPPQPPYYQYPNYYPAPPAAIPYEHHHRVDPAHPRPPNWVHRYPCGPMVPPPTPYVEHQSAVTIRNDVNIKKETLRIEPDVSDPGKFLVTFTFDAASAGSITVVFFAKEGEDFCLTPTKESLHPPVTLQFQQGLSQKFQQLSGTGIELSMFSEAELSKEGEMDVYPLAVKAEALLDKPNGPSEDNSGPDLGSTNSQITQAVFEKEKGEYRIKAVKQILWVNGVRYEMQVIYDMGSVDSDFDANDPGKECSICLSEPQDTTVLPCGHMTAGGTTARDEVQQWRRGVKIFGGKRLAVALSNMYSLCFPLYIA